MAANHPALPAASAAPSPHASIYPAATLYDYRISAAFTREHSNPPLCHQRHSHDFTVTLHLQAVRPVNGLYGLDMIALETALQDWATALPPSINDHPDCPHGTTEELCLYFSKMPLEAPIRLLTVAVGETPERVTILVL